MPEKPRNSTPMLYLASASPRRQELLRQLGLSFEVMPSHIHEERQPGESPVDYVRRVAADKARHIVEAVAAAGKPMRPVLGADTEVVIDGDILGKPQDRRHAATMLRRLAGREHTVLTGLCLIAAGREHVAVSESRVTVAPLSDVDVAAYVDTGEADDKAGAYAIQGRAAGFIARLEGSYSGVMGLPLFELRDILIRAGLNA